MTTKRHQGGAARRKPRLPTPAAAAAKARAAGKPKLELQTVGNKKAQAHVPRFDRLYTEVRQALGMTAGGDDGHDFFVDTGDILDDIAGAFQSHANGLELATFGGSGNGYALQTVAAALRLIADQVREDGSVTL